MRSPKPHFLLQTVVLMLLPHWVSASQLQTIEATPQLIPSERLFDAVIEAVNQSTVSAQTSGRITELNYDVDDFVPKGAVILRVRDREQQARMKQAQASLREAKARLDEASDEHKRVKDIYAKKLIAKSELDKAAAAFKAAKARVDQAEAQLSEAKEQLGYTVVKAPYSGFVTKRHVEVGETVSPGKPLMTGFSIESLRATTHVPQAFVSDVRRHAQARVELPDGRSLNAVSMRVFPYADESSHAFKVRVNMPEGDHDVYPGMFVKVAFVTGLMEGLLIPERAIVQRSELTALYVVGADGRVNFRQVRLGRKREGSVEILAGLEPGEQVALDPVSAAIVLKQQGR